jgi:hypothetical protein
VILTTQYSEQAEHEVYNVLQTRERKPEVDASDILETEISGSTHTDSHTKQASLHSNNQTKKL